MSARAQLLERYLQASPAENDEEVNNDYKVKSKSKKKKRRRKDETRFGGNVSIKDEDIQLSTKDFTEEKDERLVLGSDDGPVIVDIKDETVPGTDSDSDISVSRRRVRHDSSEDEVEAKGDESDSDISLPRKESGMHRHDSSDSELSVPQKLDSNDNSEGVEKQKKIKKEKEKGGLQGKEEYVNNLQKKMGDQNKSYSEKEELELGKNAETVYRDAKGRKLGMLTEYMKTQDLIEGKKYAENQLKYEWGTGKVDRDKVKEKQEYFEQLKNEKFSRYADDEALNEDLKTRVRSGDPMASFLTKPTIKTNSKKLEPVSRSRPLYSGPPAPPNRFGIQPGYRWDGIDRGNGFERRYLKAQNARKAAAEEEYRYTSSGI